MYGYEKMNIKYEYIAIYVDDILIASEEPHTIILNLKRGVRGQDQMIWTTGIPSWL